MKKQTILALAVASFLGTSPLMAAEYAITSPNGHLKLTLSVEDSTTYSVALLQPDGTWRGLVAPSPIAMTIKGGAVWGKNVTVQAVSVDSSTVAAPRVTPLLYGKAAELRESYRELTVACGDYSIVARAYDEGVAYRFVSHVADGAVTTVMDEQACFNFAENVTVWYPGMSPLDKMGNDENYERWYTKFAGIASIREDLDKTNSNDFRYSAVPMLFGFDGGSGVKVAIAESDLHHYPALYLQPNKPVNGMKGFWSKYPRTQTKGDQWTGPKITAESDTLALNTGPMAYPWRAIIVAEQDKDLLTNQLVYKLSEPTKTGIDFEFVKDRVGKSAWEYWHDAILEISGVPSGWNHIPDNGVNIYTQYIYLAAKYGWKYITIDTDGKHNLTYEQQSDILDTAAKYGIEVVKWDYIADILARPTRLQGLKSTGYTCAKVDFFYRSDQQGMEYIENLADDAAKIGMALLLHGCPIPTGLQRTYPNILSYEAVTGEENYKWDEKRAGGRLPTATYHVSIPFIRQLVGPMDYTPGSLRNVHYDRYQPVWNGIPRSIGTRAHEMAMYVMYDMPIAYMCDNPNSYYNGGDVMKFLSKVPTTWDESIPLDGKVGEYALIAKRKGNAWFVGGMVNETPHTFSVDLSFLPAGEVFSAIIYKDNPSTSGANAAQMQIENTVLSSTSKFTIPCVNEGGFVIQLFQANSDDDPDKPNVPTAVNKHPEANAVQAYYSYDTATLNVRSLAGNIRAAHVVSMAGSTVAQQAYSGAAAEEKLSVPQLSAGIYVVGVETTTGVYSTKILLGQ